MGAAKNLEEAIDAVCEANEPSLTGEEAEKKILQLDRLQQLECVEVRQAVTDLESKIAAGQIADGPTTIDPDSLDAAFLEFEGGGAV